jgi:DNA mismatch repair protein MSH4
MTMLYKVKSGPLEEENYGLSLAKVIGFPDRFMHVAKTVSMTLKRQIEEKRQDSQSRKLTQRRKLILHLYETLKQLRESDMDDTALGSYMKRLQDEFVVRMDEIENGAQADDEEEMDTDSFVGTID